MKKFYLSLLSITFGLAVNAQTLTDANHSPIVGDMYSTWQCDSFPGAAAISPGASGAGAMWNYVTIATHSSVVNNYTAVANGTSSYPIPGIAVQSSINNISYYKSNGTDLNYWGGNISIGGINATLTYSAGASIATYPMNLNTNQSAVTGGSITIPALSQNGTFTGNSSTIADGTGTLVTPSGTFVNAIRVITSQTISFNVPLATGTVTQKNYDYYEAGVKNPLFTITTATASTSLGAPSSQTVVTRSNPSTVGIKENKQLLTDLLVFPNPASTAVNFTTESKEAKTVTVYDVAGKLIEKQNLTDGKLKLDITDYAKGLYLYNVTGANNQTLKTGKITVSH
ncbi:MAG: T9SS type A sorting domain-containing protein [Bacteroidia bacterium]